MSCLKAVESQKVPEEDIIKDYDYSKIPAEVFKPFEATVAQLIREGREKESLEYDSWFLLIWNEIAFWEEYNSIGGRDFLERHYIGIDKRIGYFVDIEGKLSYFMPSQFTRARDPKILAKARRIFFEKFPKDSRKVYFQTKQPT